MNTNETQSPTNGANQGANAVKEFFTIKDFNYEYDLRKLIIYVKKMRLAQKQFFANAKNPNRQECLLKAKQSEIELEKLCNELWTKHKLKTLVTK